MTNPQNWAVIYSIMNVQRLVRIWVQDIETAQSDFNTMNGYMLSTFTSHNFKMAVFIAPQSLLLPEPDEF